MKSQPVADNPGSMAKLERVRYGNGSFDMAPRCHDVFPIAPDFDGNPFQPASLEPLRKTSYLCMVNDVEVLPVHLFLVHGEAAVQLADTFTPRSPLQTSKVKINTKSITVLLNFRL